MTHEANEVCPHCGSDQRGAEIPEQYLREGSYGPWDGVSKRYFHRTIMVEVRGVYDGGLYFQCPDCGKAWHRWQVGSEMYKRAVPYVNAQNQRVDEANADRTLN